MIQSLYSLLGINSREIKQMFIKKIHISFIHIDANWKNPNVYQ